MNKIESAATLASGELQPLRLEAEVAMPTLSTCWLVAAAGVIGGAAGYYYGHVNCKNHGCVQETPEVLAGLGDLRDMSSGGMVALRTAAARAAR
ncbi:hypothetical protein [Amycolatopsis tolypomycina]|uniref:Uncharacterized protein n=1 Tax=Amycolatopsis tolypomycina TaxID=208445 RepID=A0A1H4V4H6_9PSEU|nr:hypothetical protein [Amycolatopsis tolypomycina]SEC75857.1 hypothetical protein SAMN04489727_4972 [Amycolatopsis tolypomycina]